MDIRIYFVNYILLRKLYYKRKEEIASGGMSEQVWTMIYPGTSLSMYIIVYVFGW